MICYLNRFIQKQGLDHTFYECDSHLWRLFTRKLPTGIRIDGGSDWVGLHRDFCKYVVNSKNELNVGLKTVYKYSLLPAEVIKQIFKTNSTIYLHCYIFKQHTCKNIHIL